MKAGKSGEQKSREPGPPSARPELGRIFRILLVDDHPVVRTGYQMVIETQPGLEVCGGVGSVSEALTAIERENPDLVITDLTMPGRGGLELIKDLAAVRPETRVLVCSMHDELIYAERCLRAGARGYIMKEAPGDQLLVAIRTITAGGVWVSPRLGSQIVGLFTGATSRGSKSLVEKLTDREFDVFRLFGEGKSTKEAASALNLSPKTVAVHRDNIKSKLGIHTTAELLRHAIRWVESQGISSPSAPSNNQSAT
jgi:DNA-binding NarL/FixJ family response regulator